MKKLLFSLLALMLTLEVLAQEQTGEKRILISFAGDCTLGGYKGQAGPNLFSDYYKKYGNEYFFKNVKNVFENDDITFINLEGPLTSVPQVAVKQFPIRGEVDYVGAITCSSIEVCNLANNHIFDCGQAGFNDCVKNLKKASLGVCGEGYTFDTIVKNVHVGFLGYRIFTVTESLKNTFKSDVKKLREKGVEIICVMMHGGEEGTHNSNSTQESIGRYFADNGADIVIGHHPHVIQGIESYKGKTIIYSMGNFCFGANKNPRDKNSFIFQQEFIVKDGVVSYGEDKIIPCKISSSDVTNTYQPTIQEGDAAKNIIEKLKSYSTKYPKSYFDK